MTAVPFMGTPAVQMRSNCLRASPLPEDLNFRYRFRTRRKPPARGVGNSPDSICVAASGKPYIVGVPLAPPQTLVGERLVARLLERPHIFVEGIQQELGYLHGEADKPSVNDWTDGWAPEDGLRSFGSGRAAVPPPTCFQLHGPGVSGGSYAAEPVNGRMATRVCELPVAELSPVALSQSFVRRQYGLGQYGASPSVSLLRADDDIQEDDCDSDHLTYLSSGDEVEDLERQAQQDVLYLWAIAEAYLRHPIMHGAMKKLLNRQPQQMLLPVGMDGMTLESSVALLDPEHRGMYLVGGVKYAEVRLERTPLNAVWTQRRQDATDAVIQCHPTGLNPTMPADKLVELLFGVEPSDQEQLKILSRRSIAEKYLDLIYLGYHERRVSNALASVDINCSVELATAADQISQGGTLATRPEAGMRTHEAAEIARRHVDAMMGTKDKTTFTTTWQLKHMVHEARYFGRSLCDGEQYVFVEFCTAPTLTGASYGPNFNNLGRKSA